MTPAPVTPVAATPTTLIPEAFAYTLTLGGRFAGTQDWVVRPDKGTLVVRVQSDFSGALPAGRRVQESRIELETGYSLAYAEAEGSSRKPHFETIFDRNAGTVTLRQGKDEASQPLLEGHHDPLSLLLWLRGQTSWSQAGTAQADAPAADPTALSAKLVGGRVHVQTLQGGSMQGLEARVYFLRPGGAYVYVEQQAPHRLLRLIQPSDFGPVEALLTLERPGVVASREAARVGVVQGHVRPVRGQVGKPRRRNTR